MTLTGTVSAPGPVYPPSGETVTVTINGVNQNATISGSVGAFSVIYNTATIPYSATPYTITYGYTGDANFSAAANNTSTALTVNKATPAISGVTGSQVITYGTASVTLSGTVSAPGPVYPPSGETVTVTINGVNQNATISGSVGAFSVTTTRQPHLIRRHPTPSRMDTQAMPILVPPRTTRYNAYGQQGDAGDQRCHRQPSITYGTASVTLTGTVSAPGAVYPPNGETVTVTINGVNQNATISGSVGGFSVIFPTATIPVSATPYTITYAYAGDANFNAAANNTSTTLTVIVGAAAQLKVTT